MCSSPFYSVLFFDAEHKQLAENVIQSHDDELYRKLRDPVIPVQNIYQQCHAGHFDKESGNPRTEKFSISRNLSALLLSKTNFLFVM